MFRALLIAAFLLAAPMAAMAEEAAPAGAGEVRITSDTKTVSVETEDGPVIIQRNPDQSAVIEPAFAKTSRKCPPFCIQPMEAAPGVKTVAELEVIDFLKGKKGVLVDARTTDWHLKGTIPGSVNVPYTDITSPDALEEFGCKGTDCSGAKTLCLYCNGPWCGQSPTAIKALLKAGYPAGKLLYYRGGVQNWKGLGLNMVEGSI